MKATTLAGKPVTAGATTRPARHRPAPERRPELAHLTLPALREYRQALIDEENKVSYWRRILQARLDVVRCGVTNPVSGAAALRDALSQERVGRGRQALVQVLPATDFPPMPNLAGLWAREYAEGADADALVADLEGAEQSLSAYRTALHRRLDAATGELIARYRERPTLCLSALPLPPDRREVAAG